MLNWQLQRSGMCIAYKGSKILAPAGRQVKEVGFGNLPAYNVHKTNASGAFAN